MLGRGILPWRLTALAAGRRIAAPGFSLIEVLISLTLLGLVLGGAFRLFAFFTGPKVANISARLQLQMETRRALVNLYSEAQEGIEVLKPDPGATLPYLVLRDLVNNLHFIFLKKDAVLTEKVGSDIFRLYSVVYDVTKAQSSQAHELLSGLSSMNFTSHGFGAFLVTGTLREGEMKYSFINMIRLKNVSTDEGK